MQCALFYHINYGGHAVRDHLFQIGVEYCIEHSIFPINSFTCIACVDNVHFKLFLTLSSSQRNQLYVATIAYYSKQ